MKSKPVNVLELTIFISIADELNCTWGSWSTFSPCTATCDAGIQHRERRCESVDPDLREYRIETDIQTCNIEACPEGTSILV